MRTLAVVLLIGAWFAATSANPPVQFRHHVIDADGPADLWLKTVGDLDGDGKLDLVAGGAAKGGLVWYRNPDWKKHLIADGNFSTDGEVVDMDGDGDRDVVALINKPPALVWYENPGWRRHVISDLRLHDVEVCDFNRDGRPDMVARDQGSFSGKGDVVHFFRHEPGGKWTRSSMQVSNGEGLHMADLDGDGDLDLAIERVWYENTGDPIVKPWVGHEYAPGWTHLFTFAGSGPIAGTKRPDLVLAPAERAGTWYRISWFEAPRNPKTGKWREHVVDERAEAVHHFVGAADFNGDGRPDIAAAQMRQGADPDEVKIYINPGRGKVWQKAVVSTGGSHSMRIADIDGDGDMDLYGANWRGTTVVEWWENLLKSRPAR